MEEHDNNKTAAYVDSKSINTGIYGNTVNQNVNIDLNNLNETGVYPEIKSSEYKSKTHGVGVGDKIIVEGIEYSITGIISEETGEAVIYKIKNESQNTLALKLYFEFSNPKQEPNYETLKRIREINDPNILKLYQFGVGVSKYQGKYCYEICDYAFGGDLFAPNNFKLKYKKDFIEKSVVPDIFHGIRKLHESKIYHCDLKPSNIFFKDIDQKFLLIGDYGSAKAYDLEIENDVGRSSTVKGTEAYLSPEQVRGIVSEKNDYYSFGIILLHLLYPEQLASDNNIRNVDKDKFEKIVIRQYDSKPIVNFDPAFNRLNNLIEGLTLINHKNRFGKTELDKWLDGEDLNIKYNVVEINSVTPINLGYATIKSDKDLIGVLENQINWYEDLIEDKDSFSTLKNWLDLFRNIPSRKVFVEMIRFYQPLGKNYIKEAIIRYFDPKREIKIGTNSFSLFTSNDIIKDVEKYFLLLDNIWKTTSIEDIKFYIFQLEFALRQLKTNVNNAHSIVVGALIDKFYSVFGLIQKPFDDFKTEIQTKIIPNDETTLYRFMINLFYIFTPTRTFKDLNNNFLKTIEDLGFFYIQNENLFKDKILTIEKTRFLEKLKKDRLNSCSFKQLIFEIFKNETKAYFELIDIRFDKYHNYKVLYKYYMSLNDFLLKKNLNLNFASGSEKIELYENKKKLFRRFNSDYESFILTVQLKHNIYALSQENSSQIRKKFLSHAWKGYLISYAGQLLALLIIITLALLIYNLFMHNVHI